jgi:hypothetical protein
MKKVLLLAFTAFLITSCEKFATQSGVYTGNISVTSDIQGTKSTVDEATTVELTQTNGVYYLDNVELKERNGKYYATDSVPGIVYETEVNFITKNSIGVSYQYNIPNQMSVSANGTLTK